MRNKILSLGICSFVMFSTTMIKAQNVGINTSGLVANSSAMLDIDATNMGLLIPRVALSMTTVAAPVTTPANSLLVYNTATAGDVTPGFYYWDATTNAWVRFLTMGGGGTSPAWMTTGNSGITAGNFIGTINAADFIIRTTNTQRMVVAAGGNVGVGDASPAALFTVGNGDLFQVVSTGHARGINGTAALPSFSFVNDNDNGMYLSNTNEVSFSTTGTQRVVITSAGFVGIGIPGPIQNLDVNGRMNVANGVIQRGPTQITVTNDLGLYSQIAGNWIRVATNGAAIRFFNDQGGANGAGTNSIMDIDNANGGGVAITANMAGATGGAPDPRAILDLQSTTKGMLTPRMTTVQRDAMGGGLAEGLLIYNIDNNCFEYWDTQANPLGLGGFWNSLCDHCDNIVIINSNQAGFNLNTYLGGAQAEHYCVFIQSGVTLQASGNGGGSGAAGNPGFNASTMPVGATVTLHNYGNILGGGGNGGQGGQESDGVCSGDNCGQVGGAGGHAIQTVNGVPITVFNYGLIRAGGGGGGGGGYGCCSSSGGGGGGAGTPAGSGGAGRTASCVRGFICGCSTSGASGAGAGGTAVTGGVGGGGNTSLGTTGCPTCNASGAITGATGGVNGVAGNTPGGTCPGGGGTAGLALQGSGSGSSIANFGTVTGAVNP